MALEILTEDKITIQEKTTNWSTAIQEAAQPLLNDQFITKEYINEMIDSVNELGPYIVIAPEIAIAHARPNENVNKVGLSLLKLNQHINFSEDGHFASLIFVLSAIDSHSHLSVLQDLAKVLGDKDKVGKLLETQKKSEILNILKEND